MCPGLQQDVPRQLGHEKTPPHSRPTSPRVCRVRQSICGELKAEETPVGPHWGKAFPGLSVLHSDPSAAILFWELQSQHPAYIRGHFQSDFMHWSFQISYFLYICYLHSCFYQTRPSSLFLLIIKRVLHLFIWCGLYLATVFVSYLLYCAFVCAVYIWRLWKTFFLGLQPANTRENSHRGQAVRVSIWRLQQEVCPVHQPQVSHPHPRQGQVSWRHLFCSGAQTSSNAHTCHILPWKNIHLWFHWESIRSPLSPSPSNELGSLLQTHVMCVWKLCKLLVCLTCNLYFQ